MGRVRVLARRDRVNTAAMLSLGSWAVGNIGISTALYFSSAGSTRAFHEMNVLGNLVNLGLAGAGLYGSRHAESSPDLFTSVERQHGLEKTLLFNAGLDAAYIMTGLFLMERSRSAASQAERLQGYGQSLLLQGGFLLGFDLVVYLIQRRSRSLLRQALS